MARPVFPHCSITAFLSAATLLLSGCGGGARYIVIGNAESPSAAGVLEVEQDDEHSEATIDVEFLAAPESRDPESTYYVVWFVRENGKAVRGGKLDYDRDQRTGRAEVTGPPAPYDLLITAERSTTPQEPSEHRVLVQTVTAE